MLRNFKRLEKVLDIPESVIDDITKVTCIGNNKILVENYIGILEYDDNSIRLNTGNGDVFVYGENLVINQLTTDDILIWGKVHMVEFER